MKLYVIRNKKTKSVWMSPQGIENWTKEVDAVCDWTKAHVHTPKLWWIRQQDWEISEVVFPDNKKDTRLQEALEFIRKVSELSGGKDVYTEAGMLHGIIYSAKEFLKKKEKV